MTAQVISTTSGSATNGGSVTLTFASALPGDVMVVAYATTTLKTMVATTSSAGAYTTLLTTGNGTGSVLSFGVHRYVQPATVSVQTICSGTGTATDATAAVGIQFRFVSTSSPEDATTTSSIGTSSTPNSPSITVATVDDAIISLFGLFNNTAGTAPVGFLNSISTGATDTRSCRVGLAWSPQGSTAAIDPPSWTGFTSGTWCAATVALRSAYTWLLSEKLPIEHSEEAKRVIARSY